MMDFDPRAWRVIKSYKVKATKSSSKFFKLC